MGRRRGQSHRTPLGSHRSLPAPNFWRLQCWRSFIWFCMALGKQEIGTPVGEIPADFLFRGSLQNVRRYFPNRSPAPSKKFPLCAPPSSPAVCSVQCQLSRTIDKGFRATCTWQLLHCHMVFRSRRHGTKDKRRIPRRHTIHSGITDTLSSPS